MTNTNTNTNNLLTDLLRKLTSKKDQYLQKRVDIKKKIELLNNQKEVLNSRCLILSPAPSNLALIKLSPTEEIDRQRNLELFKVSIAQIEKALIDLNKECNAIDDALKKIQTQPALKKIKHKKIKHNDDQKNQFDLVQKFFDSASISPGRSGGLSNLFENLEKDKSLIGKDEFPTSVGHFGL